MSDINSSLRELLEINGAICASLVDATSGMVLGEVGSGVDMELAAAGNSEVVKAKLNTMKSLGINEKLEDILVTIESQFHVIRPIENQEGLFIYLALKKDKANLALARRKVLEIEKQLIVK